MQFWKLCAFFSLITLSYVAAGTNSTCVEELNFENKTSEQILYLLTDPCRYDRWKRPPNENDKPTWVFTRIYVYFIGNVEAQHLQYTTHALIRYRWMDQRLARNVTYNIIGETLVKERLWTPHLYIVNEHDSRIMGSSSQDVLVTVMPDGTVLYSTRLKVSLLCLMNLRKFPFDEQECPLILESWTYNTKELMLSWEPISPVVQNSHLHMTEYNLVSIWTNSTFVLYSLPDSHYNSAESYHYYGKFAGNYSSLTVFFQIEREFGHYIMDYYVPSILIVTVSWVTFWLDPNAVPGRTTLGTSTMLTFITLSRNTGSSLPKVSYIKATEIWFIGCTIFIFGSLVEFAFVNTIWRRRKDIELKKVTSKHVLRATLTPQLNRRSISTVLTSSTQSLPSIQQVHENNIRLKILATPAFDDFLDPPMNKPTRHQANMYQFQKNEFLFVKRNPKVSSKQTLPSIDSICSEPVNSCITINEPNPGLFKMTPQQIACWIDKRSRLFFPIAFLIFNIFYWIFVWL